ncbi:MAG: hypothetical protein A2117_00940 [Candidatus Wildermuthbacteria bacterium GWA2_46_15]|uniref:Uncharacterized protein n=1 Tax=Candidatus Wildermuthbacteria bacterium GWA2_46_15 TaxID=1802443 RepID=A0A1G2QRQ1_9BACT|nr:MAG: hypothetical protein A2117_00940 [Candidatus Wildermuthbacteria bacterium GWA2_46_15]
MIYFLYLRSIFYGIAFTLLFGSLLTAPKLLADLTVVGVFPDLIQVISGVVWAIVGIFGWEFFKINKPDEDELALHNNN